MSLAVKTDHGVTNWVCKRTITIRSIFHHFHSSVVSAIQPFSLLFSPCKSIIKLILTSLPTRLMMQNKKIGFYQCNVRSFKGKQIDLTFHLKMRWKSVWIKLHHLLQIWRIFPLRHVLTASDKDFERFIHSKFLSFSNHLHLVKISHTFCLNRRQQIILACCVT